MSQICCIECDVNLDTNKGTLCPNHVTHTWHPFKDKVGFLCEAHAARLKAAGQDVRPIEEPRFSRDDIAWITGSGRYAQ